MKKLILIIAAVALIAGNSIAQEGGTNSSYNSLIGLKVGANFSNVYDIRGDEFVADSKIGLATGLFMQLAIGKYLGIQPEILFSQKGYKSKGTLLGIAYEFTHTTSYIDLPLMIAIKPSEFITLLAGPQYSFLMKQHDEFTSGDLNINQEQEFQNDNVRKNVLCFLGGIDINLDKVVLGARAGWDIQDNNGDGTSSNPRYKNVWYQATLGFRFY